MGNVLSPRFHKLVEERKILRIKPDPEFVDKEIAASKDDLKDARESFDLGKHKWTTIQAYYAIFHGARALLFAKGYREKSHHALFVALRELYVNDIERSLFLDLEQSMYLRQEADYGSKFSETGAREVLETAEKFLAKAKTLLTI